MYVLTVVLLCAAGPLLAQDQRSHTESYTFGVNGERLGGSSSSSIRSRGDSVTTQRIRSVNGQMIPVQKVEEKVIEDSPRRRIIERTIQRYSQDGRPAPPAKVRIEERTDSSGQLTTTTTTDYQADINGAFKIKERSTTQSLRRGPTTTSTTVIERPTLNGAMETVQRRQATDTDTENGHTREETIYDRDVQGRLQAASQEVTAAVQTDTGERITRTEYNTLNSSRRMAFTRQFVTETERRPDGSESTVISEYRPAAPGRSIASGQRQAHLREQQIIERQVRPDGSVVEITGVRRASLSDPNRLGAYQKVAETICTGNCLEESDTAAESKTAAEEPAGEPAP